jgi:glyoxylase-like metal-dependent hydrolase (beta-lactamase superfamily II)
MVYSGGCPAPGVCAVVDPQGEPQGYIDQVENNGMAVKFVIETHLHAYHVSCARELGALTGAALYPGPGTEAGFAHTPLADGQVLEVGRVDLARNNIPAEVVRARAEQLHDSLSRLLALPDDVEVYPGHYAGSVCGRGMDGKTISTIGRERRHNPVLRLSREAFAEFQTQNTPALPADFHAIKRHNVGHD